MEIEHCAVCSAEFRKGSLDGKPCETCQKLFPGATSKDNKFKKKPSKSEEEASNNIRKEIDAVLEEYGILRRCVCGKLYFKRSPAQKSCGSDCTYTVDKKETN